MKILKLICIVCILLLSTTAFAEEICTNATTKERISTLEGTFKDRVKIGVDSFNLQKAGDCVAFRNKHDHEAVVNSLLKRSTPEGSKSQKGFFDFIVCNPKFSMNPDGTYDYSTIEGRFCKIGDVSELGRRMVKFFIWVAIFVAAIMIVYDAVKILTNRENATILSIFKKRLWHAIMGVIIILFSYWIIDTLLATINLKETFQFLR